MILKQTKFSTRDGFVKIITTSLTKEMKGDRVFFVKNIADLEKARDVAVYSEENGGTLRAGFKSLRGRNSAEWAGSRLARMLRPW
jgi:hypothetical protein